MKHELKTFIVECDLCKKKVKMKGKEEDLPKGWKYYDNSFNGYKTEIACPKCSKKDYNCVVDLRG